MVRRRDQLLPSRIAMRMRHENAVFWSPARPQRMVRMHHADLAGLVGINPNVGPESRHTRPQEDKIIQIADIDECTRSFPCALSRRGPHSRAPRNNEGPEAALRMPCFRSDAVRAMDQLQTWL